MRSTPRNPSMKCCSNSRWLRLVLLFAATVGVSGCTRQKWHNQADDVAYSLVESRYNDPRWTNPRTDVIADPRSRFYDPTDLDCAPLPPDDEAAHEYMHRVFGIKGYAHWHKFGDLSAVESPDWLTPWGLSEQTVTDNFKHNGMYPEVQDFTLGEAIMMAYLHSRDYQTQVEQVFLTALALSFERFRFQVQFVGLTAVTPIGSTNGNKPGFIADGIDVPGVEDSVGFNPAAGVQQLTPWGSQWLVGLANSTLWFWADGDSSDATASTLSYSLIQPLLAGAGKRVVLENLTQAERNMLYAVRDFARYRMGFFTQVAVGGTIAGVSGTGQPGVGTGVNTIASPTLQGGYLGLLQNLQTISNQEFNIRLLQDSLNKTRERASQPRRPSVEFEKIPEGLVIPDDMVDLVFFRNEPLLDENNRPLTIEEGGEVKTVMINRLYVFDRLTDEQRERLLNLSDDPKWKLAILQLIEKAGQFTRNQQVAQLETQLASNYNQLRQTRTTYLNNLDNYKITLGLPTSFPLTISRELLKPFELVDPRLTRLVDRLNVFVPDPPLSYDDHPDTESMQRVQRLMDRFDRADPSQEVLQGLVLELFDIRDDVAQNGIAVLNSDYERALEHIQKGVTPRPIDPGLQVYDATKLRELRDRQVAEFEFLEDRLQALRKKVLEPNLPLLDRQRVAASINDLREDFLTVVQGITGVEANLRMEQIDLNPFDLEMDEAVEIGLDNRLDLKNVQAQVMDARRKVEVAANALQAVLNIRAEGDIRTQSLFNGNNNPFDFRGDESEIRLGIQFTTPIQLVQQRNTYRAALIGYQQARRNYMRVEDQVKLDIRTTWRNIELFQRNFATAKANLQAAVIQYDIANEQTTAPTGAQPGGGGGGGGNAAQGLNILNALNALLNAQNQLIQTWVSYESNRLNIHNFMGILTLDEAGFWTDDFYQRARPLGDQPDFVVRPSQPNLEFLPDLRPSDNPLLPPAPSQELNNAGPEPLDRSPLPPAARRKPGRERKIQYASTVNDEAAGLARVDRSPPLTVRGSSPERDHRPGPAGARRNGGRLEQRLHRRETPGGGA